MPDTDEVSLRVASRDGGREYLNELRYKLLDVAGALGATSPTGCHQELSTSQKALVEGYLGPESRHRRPPPALCEELGGGGVREDPTEDRRADCDGRRS